MTPLWPMTQDRAECGWAPVDGIRIVRGRKRHASHPILLQSARERAQWGYEIPGCIDPGPGCHVRTQRRSRLDRKSTRLNSSHVAISYAVFCLKKKTQGHLRIAEFKCRRMPHHRDHRMFGLT